MTTPDTTQIPKPKNRREFFKWLFFEPIRFKDYRDSLDKKSFLREFLRSYAWIALIAVLIWILVNLIITVFDLPAQYTGLFSKEIVNGWQNHTFWLSKFISFSNATTFGLILGLAVGLFVGSVVGLIEELSGRLAFGLAVGLTGGLTFGLAFGLATGLAIGLAGGLAIGLARGITFGLARRLAIGFAGGLVAGLVFGLGGRLGEWSVGELVLVGGGMIWWNIFYFRIFPFYPIYFVKSLFFNRLSNNLYRNDGLIWLPILGLKSKLIGQSRQNPKEALEFIDFLLEYRPMQKTLAMHLTHAATAGLWLQNDFNAEALKNSPTISKDKSKFKPSKKWYQKLEAVRESLVSTEQQSSISYKLEYFERCISNLKEFEQINLRESPRWNHYYFNALRKWKQKAEEEYERLKLLEKTREPVTRNIYRAGDALNPEFDKNIFLGRDDLKEELQNKILSSPTMPMFLINGQRRVGKTSLLKFLPEILGTRFKVVYMDLQPMAGINEWLNNLKKEFDLAFKVEHTPLPQTENWPDTWKALQNHLEEAAKKEECKIILAFDEYEKAHYHFQKDPEAAANLLDAMRSFSQHQNKIVFLFVGAALFSELKNPHWSNYFVQAVLLKVDYLDKDQTFKLIDVAKLQYPQEVLEKIYRLAQGHPTLVQRICHEMVNIANTLHRKTMNMEDLDTILEKHIYRPQNGVVEVFWGQFCAEETRKTTVRQIIANVPPTDKKALFALLEHGFVIKDGDRFKMRVPIFEEWVKRFGDVV